MRGAVLREARAAARAAAPASLPSLTRSWLPNHSSPHSAPFALAPPPPRRRFASTRTPSEDSLTAWSELPSDRRDAWKILGWTEASWDGADSPPLSDYKEFDALSVEQRSAALYGLGYDAASWNEEEGEQRQQEDPQEGEQQQQQDPPAFVPENAVERMLMAAAKANGKDGTTTMFHKELMKAECVYFIDFQDERIVDENAAEPMVTVSMKTLKWEDGKEYFPFFTSLPRLEEFARGAPKGQKIVAQPLSPRVFLQITQDKPPGLIVNPASMYVKAISKYEAEGLLDGTYLGPGGGDR